MEDGSLPSEASIRNPTVATAATVVAVVQNPYAKKRPKLETTTATTTAASAAATRTAEKPMTSRELLLKHLQLPPEEEDVDDDDRDKETGDKGESSSSSCLETQPKDALQGLPSPPTSTMDSNASHQLQATAAAAAVIPQFTSQWQNSSRLSASQQLSFGSAEILTISEYLQHCGVLFREKKSVRLTGRLTHRIVHSPTMISFVLRDPLESLQQKATTATRTTTTTIRNPKASLSKDTRLSAATSTARPQRPPSLGGRPSSNSSSSSKHMMKRSSLLSSSATTTTSHRLVYKKTPGGLRRTPAAAAAATTTTVRTTSATGIIGNTTCRLKDPPPQQQNPMQTLVQALTTTTILSLEKSNIDKLNHPCAGAVWIIANPQHVMVQDCVVGDLVMILGQVGCLEDDNNNNGGGVTTNATNALPPAMGFEKEDAAVLEQIRMATAAKQPQQQQQQLQQQPQHYVTARICRNVNGTDMSLFTQALMTRRKFLRAIGNTGSSQNHDDGVDDEDCKRTHFRPGWGPPLPTKGPRGL